jgi:hypothetical protein
LVSQSERIRLGGPQAELSDFFTAHSTGISKRSLGSL